MTPDLRRRRPKAPSPHPPVKGPYIGPLLARVNHPRFLTSAPLCTRYNCSGVHANGTAARADQGRRTARPHPQSPPTHAAGPSKSPLLSGGASPRVLRVFREKRNRLSFSLDLENRPMVEVVGEDGGTDFLVGLGELCRWTGYSDEWIRQLAKEGVVRRRGRGRYLLRASLRGLLDRARERNQDRLLDQILTADLGLAG